MIKRLIENIKFRINRRRRKKRNRIVREYMRKYNYPHYMKKENPK